MNEGTLQVLRKNERRLSTYLYKAEIHKRHTARRLHVFELLEGSRPFSSGGVFPMKIKCKKCLIVLTDNNMTFEDVEIYSRLDCGSGGTHIFMGAI